VGGKDTVSISLALARSRAVDSFTSSRSGLRPELLRRRSSFGRLSSGNTSTWSRTFGCRVRNVFCSMVVRQRISFCSSPSMASSPIPIPTAM